MGFSSVVYRGIRLLCRPFVKLDNRIQCKIAQKEKAKEKAEADWGQAFPNANARDAFFARIGVITHAGGGLQGLAYLNCEEAFPYYYEKGNRVFEYDVDEKNGAFVLAHVENGETMDLDGRFSPMSIEKCLDNLKTYPDITVIFDCKFSNLTDFARLIKEYVVDETALDRVVIQVFNEENVLQVRSVYDFKTLHVCMLATDYVQTLQTCIKYHIGAVSISTKALQERFGWEIFEKNNICTFAYTVNTVKTYRYWKERGITGIFSDFLYDSDLRKE
ncbi:MAG: hypothetical protein E7355_03030 [Clostridiales bacterium]|nr:hypothetical protein [Clostridiales bacterium]